MTEEQYHLNEYLDFSECKILYVDTETTGLTRFDMPGSIGIMDDTGRGTYLAFRHEMGKNLPEEEVIAYVKRYMEDVNIIKCFHNAKFDISMLAKLGIEVLGEIRDTMIMASLLNENRKTYGLKPLAEILCGMPPTEKNKLTQWLVAMGYEKWQVLKAPVELAGPYCFGDVLRTKALHDYFWPEMQNYPPLLDVFKTECDICSILALSERHGIRIDKELLLRDKEVFAAEVDRLTQEIQDMVGIKTFNPLSDLHIEQFFIKNNLPIPRTFKGNCNFDKKNLKKLVSQLYTKCGTLYTPEENVVAEKCMKVLNKILELRSKNTVLSTFIQQYLDLEVDGRIYTTFNALRGEQGGAVTGRMSSDTPNMQNLKNPKKDKESGELTDGGARVYFKPDEDYILVSLDYSQIEYRLFVHYSNDQAMIQSYIDNPWIDYHQKVSDDLGQPRKKGKGINFGLLYAMGKRLLAENIDFDPDDPFQMAQAEKLFKEYHKKYPTVSALRRDVEKAMHERGWVRNMFGRYRHISEPAPGCKDERYKSLNSLIQGCAADLLKFAIRRVWHEVCKPMSRPDSLVIPLLYVHDEIVFMLKPERLDEFLHKAIPVMQDFPQVKVPIRVDVEVFKDNWAQGEELKLEWNR